MMRRRLLTGVFLLLICSTTVYAAERKSFFLSFGYLQNFMFTGDNSSSGGDDANVDFDGGYGTFLTPAYQGGGRWGIQLPLHFSYHGLSRSRLLSDEHVFYFGGDIAALVRFFKKPRDGLDPYFSFGLGLDRVTEGTRDDGSASTGFDLYIALGLDYHFHDHWAAHIEVPLKAILFVGDNLSSDTTSVVAIPLTFGITWKF